MLFDYIRPQSVFIHNIRTSDILILRIITNMSAPIYHVLNRGVDKRIIFMDNEDRFRFIHDIFEFNDIESVNNLTYLFRKGHKGNNFHDPSADEYKDVGHPYIHRKPRKMLVNILAFCLMPNHYHLLLSPRVEHGVSLFMKKINGGYAKYFNEKYKRSGALFQGRYKSVQVVKEIHFIHLPYYIHLNPLDLITSEWRERKLKNIKKAVDFLEKYRWSSHLDYCGKKNFPSVTQRNFLLEFFNGEKEYRKAVESWLKDFNLSEDKNLFLE